MILILILTVAVLVLICIFGFRTRKIQVSGNVYYGCLLYTSPSPRD